MTTPPQAATTGQEVCPHCGAKIRRYWHKLTPLLVHALLKLNRAVVVKGENRIHLVDDMTGENKLTGNEWTNFTKLRFHALAAKVWDGDRHDRGYWLLTRRGAPFLRGEIAVPVRVQTYRNRVVGHDQHFVFIKDVLGSQPYVETIDDIEYEVGQPVGTKA